MRLLPKRRWLRFSVRTLLIAVTIFCVWLGWQVSIVRERTAMRRWIVAHDGVIDPLDFSWVGAASFEASHSEPPPLVRRLLGDQRVSLIHLPVATGAEVDRVRSAIPDAVISVGRLQDSH